MTMTLGPRRRSNLPPDRAAFIGRSAELALLRERFEAGDRCVSLIGPSGLGKTRLALRIAGEERPAYESEGGVWFCELGEARTAADLVARVTATLGVVGAGDADTEKLADALAARGPILLLLDSCEHLEPDARAVLETCLDRAQEARLLVTSLVRLGLSSEFCFELPPLTREDAVALYLERARRTEPGAALDPGEVAALVERLDRNPLAIQLAAARARTLRPSQLLGRLDRRLALLVGGRPGRHESLQRAIGCSWELLSPCEAHALSQCAVFAGGFTLEAAEAVVELSGFSGAPSTLDVLEALRNKALVRASSDDPPRFALYESVRDYALGELEASGGAQAALLRHANYFIELGASQVDGELETSRLKRLGAEEENLLAAHHRMVKTAPGLAARAALALEGLIYLRGVPPATPVRETAVACARASGDPVLLARVLRASGAILARNPGPEGQRRSELPRGQLEESIALARAAGVVPVECHARIELARLLALEGDADRATAMLEECLVVADRQGLSILEGIALNELGVIASNSGRLDLAVGHFERATRALGGRGSARRDAQVRLNLGAVLVGLGRVDEAERMMEQARDLARVNRDLVVQANAAVNLGNIALTDGRLDDAETLLLESRILQRDLHQPAFEALATGNLGVVAFERGRIRKARQLLDEAVCTFRSLGQKRALGAYGGVFGAVLAACGEIDRARDEFRAGRRLLAALGDAETLRVVEVFEGFVDLAEARRAGAARSGSRRAAAVARLAASSGTPGGPRRIAMRLLQQALAGWTEATVPVASEPTVAGAAFRIGPDAMWFEPPGGARCELRRRRPLRRLLHALVEQRLLSPGVGLGVDRLFEAGWPGERASAGSAAGRVYVAIRTLRHAGLEAILIRNDDGYVLDPTVAVSAEKS